MSVDDMWVGLSNAARREPTGTADRTWLADALLAGRGDAGRTNSGGLTGAAGHGGDSNRCDSVGSSLTLARRCSLETPLPGAGATIRRWEILATIAAENLTAARVIEAHLDALAILAEAQIDPATDLGALGVTADSTWGVFAAEAGGVRVDAARTQRGDSWCLTGIKPWCSLADRLSHALVTAYTGDGHRRLFAVALRDGTTTPIDQGWVSRGLPQVPSGPIELRSTPAIAIGADEWYLSRPGFAWGGAGVAACWFGGTVGLGRTVFAAATARPADQIGQLHLGAVDVALTGVRAVLAAAAQRIDDGTADGSDGVIVAGRARAVAATAAEEVLTRSLHALGPAPLAFDERHAGRVADLQMYVRQHHAERDQAALGRAVLADGLPW